MNEMVEKIVETDDALLERYFEGEEISIDELKKAIRKGTIAKTFTPVLCGSSYKNKGVQMLLDAMVEYLPSPLDIPPIKGINPDTGEEEERPADENAPFAGLAFKIMTDPYVGGLTFFRVYSGKLTAGSYVYNSNTGKQERVGRLIRMHANNRQEITEVGAGDIAAIVGLKDTITGLLFVMKNTQSNLKVWNSHNQLSNLQSNLKQKICKEKMALALAKLMREDPSFRVSTNKETGQTLIAGMGELHLEIIVDRLLREFKVEATVGEPQVSYREAIKKAVKAEGKFIRQSGGKGQYGHCIIEMEPLPAGSGYEFVDKTVGGSIPKEYIQPINNGIAEARMNGVLAGYETVDFRVTVVDGSYHEVGLIRNGVQDRWLYGIPRRRKESRPCSYGTYHEGVLLKCLMNILEQYWATSLQEEECLLEQITNQRCSSCFSRSSTCRKCLVMQLTFVSQTQGRGNYVMEPLKYQEVSKINRFENYRRRRAKKA